MSNLNKVSKNGYTYYELYISCPVCHSNGLNTQQAYWQHHNCGGELYVGDDAHYDCKKCGANSHVSEWAYGCPSHMRNAEYEFLKVDVVELSAVMSAAGQLVNGVGLAWLQKFMSNLEGKY